MSADLAPTDSGSSRPFPSCGSSSLAKEAAPCAHLEHATDLARSELAPRTASSRAERRRPGAARRCPSLRRYFADAIALAPGAPTAHGPASPCSDPNGTRLGRPCRASPRTRGGDPGRAKGGTRRPSAPELRQRPGPGQVTAWGPAPMPLASASPPLGARALFARPRRPRTGDRHG